MVIHLSPKKILILNVVIIVGLLCLNILAIFSKFYRGNEIELFDFDRENNIPSLYSTFNLLVSSVLLFLTASNCKTRNRSLYLPWLGLSAIFLFLSIDELLSIHEKLGSFLKMFFQTSGIFLYMWVIPYSIAMIVFVLVYAKFVFQLPKNILPLFLGSGAVFVLSAIGLEMLEAHHASQFGKETLLYATYYTCEEFLEMLTIAVFIYALLIQITVNQSDPLNIIITANKLPPSSEALDSDPD